MSLKKKTFPILAFLALTHSAFAADTVVESEDYKSYRPDNQFTVGVSGGFGLVDTAGGFTVIGNAATRIVKDGFIPEIVNPVFLEIEVGPLFTSGTTVWMYSTHVRWDFVKSSSWTWFALGGVGGNVANEEFGDRVALHARFGMGAFYETPYVTWRGEFSHELITVGASWPF